MTISETARLDMLSGLRTHVGEAVANTLMEHLPPGGWFDVARTGDIDRVREDVSLLRSEVGNLRSETGNLRSETGSLRADIIGLHNRIDGVEARFSDRIDKLEAKFTKQMGDLAQKIDTNTKWMIGISITYGIGILGALVTFMVASLN
jgi:tetrahydromethanopterin S-methyltransferase subunit G